MSKILLLEDDLSLINGLSFAFKKQGFELEIARTLKEARKLWVEGKYDLLVLDVSLPDGTGFEFCEKVRRVSKVPIIFLTASDEEMNIIMGLDMGADDYITKPFKLGVLFLKSMLCSDGQIHSMQQMSNCNPMGFRCFCCKDRLSKMENCWSLLRQNTSCCVCL